MRQGARVVRRGPKVSPCRRLEKTLVTLRKVPGALALGLLASLAAHAALYGGEHAMGGGYHALLMQAALAAALSLLLFFGALAWTEVGRAPRRQRLGRPAARTPAHAGSASCLPRRCGTALAEAVEPHHAGASPIAVLVALAVAAWLVLRLARALIDALAGAVIAMLRTSFSPRSADLEPPAALAAAASPHSLRRGAASLVLLRSRSLALRVSARSIQLALPLPIGGEPCLAFLRRSSPFS